MLNYLVIPRSAAAVNLTLVLSRCDDGRLSPELNVDIKLLTSEMCTDLVFALSTRFVHFIGVVDISHDKSNNK